MSKFFDSNLYYATCMGVNGLFAFAGNLFNAIMFAGMGLFLGVRSIVRS